MFPRSLTVLREAVHGGRSDGSATIRTMTPLANGRRQMQLVFADEGSILYVSADGNDVDPDVMAETLLDALAADDIKAAQRLIEGAIGGSPTIERR